MCYELTCFHLKAHCTDHQAATRPTLILTGFNGFARGEEERERGGWEGGEGGGVGGGAKTRLVRWPAVYHVLSGATGSIEPVSTQLYFLHPVGGAPENLISGHFDRNWVAADNSIIC